jgi:hypothetical protein
MSERLYRTSEVAEILNVSVRLLRSGLSKATLGPLELGSSG